MEYKIAIVGNEDAVGGFKAVGIDAIPIEAIDDAKEKIEKLFNAKDYAIIFITEDWVDKLKNFLDELPPKALPSIVAVPSQAGSTGAGLRNLKKIGILWLISRLMPR